MEKKITIHCPPVEPTIVWLDMNTNFPASEFASGLWVLMVFYFVLCFAYSDNFRKGLCNESSG